MDRWEGKHTMPCYTCTTSSCTTACPFSSPDHAPCPLISLARFSYTHDGRRENGQMLLSIFFSFGVHWTNVYKQSINVSIAWHGILIQYVHPYKNAWLDKNKMLHGIWPDSLSPCVLVQESGKKRLSTSPPTPTHIKQARYDPIHHTLPTIKHVSLQEMLTDQTQKRQVTILRAPMTAKQMNNPSSCSMSPYTHNQPQMSRVYANTKGQT